MASIDDLIVPRAEEGGEERQQPPVPRTTILNPLGVGVEKFADGSVRIELMLPMELMLINLPADGANHLRSELTGGIIPAAALPLMGTIKGT